MFCFPTGLIVKLLTKKLQTNNFCIIRTNLVLDLNKFSNNQSENKKCFFFVFHSFPLIVIKMFYAVENPGTGIKKFEPLLDQEVQPERRNYQKISVYKQCITFMENYADKSLEELRLEDYLANRTNDPDGLKKFNSPSFCQFFTPKCAQKALDNSAEDFGETKFNSCSDVSTQTTTTESKIKNLNESVNGN